MTKIRTHKFENENWGRAHLPFFKSFDKYLAEFFDVEVVNYNLDGNTFGGKINLISNTGGQFGKTPPISDVEYVIENLSTGEIKVLSFTEYFNSYAVHLAKSQICSSVLLSHFNWYNLYYWMKRDNATDQMYKIKPWIFLPFNDFNYAEYRNKRSELTEFNDKLFWLGSGSDDYRQMINFLDEMNLMQSLNNVSFDEYLDKLIKTKLALSYYTTLSRYRTPFDYPGEFCYRDIEYMILGVPFIRIEYKDTLHNPLLPNHHYISIPREEAYLAFENNGDKGVADIYAKKYHEIISDNEFLNYISNNQIEWSNNNLMNNNKEKLTFELLEIKKWIK